MPLQTVLTTRLRLRYPVIAAPLGRGSTPAFLGTLAREGAFGFAALGHIPEIELRQTLSGYIASAGGRGCFNDPRAICRVLLRRAFLWASLLFLIRR